METPHEYKCHATRVWHLFSKKDQALMGKLTVAHFRAIAGACPATLGQFDADADSLIYTVPTEPSEEWSDALAHFANMTARELTTALKVSSRRGGSRRGLAAE